MTHPHGRFTIATPVEGVGVSIPLPGELKAAHVLKRQAQCELRDTRTTYLK
jgi:hypothetical protein